MVLGPKAQSWYAGVWRGQLQDPGGQSGDGRDLCQVPRDQAQHVQEGKRRGQAPGLNPAHGLVSCYSSGPQNQKVEHHCYRTFQYVMRVVTSQHKHWLVCYTLVNKSACWNLFLSQEISHFKYLIKCIWYSGRVEKKFSLL